MSEDSMFACGRGRGVGVCVTILAYLLLADTNRSSLSSLQLAHSLCIYTKFNH